MQLDGQLVALATVAERLRDATPDALADLRRLGLPVEVLTGDAPGRAEALGLAATASLLPDDKRKRVDALVAAGHRPLFVGDGINDASALAAAPVGIALASGTDLAVSAADVTLYHGDLRAIPWAVELSRAAVRTARRNMRLAAGYNAVGVGLAAAGLLHPVAAALLMVASSLTLVFASARVGVPRNHCDNAVSPVGESPPAAAAGGLWAASLIHACCLALQGPLLVALLAPSSPVRFALLLGFSLAAVSAVVWHRWRTVPHAADMAFGMLTAGNLGMLLGWWADAGFAPTGAACCRPDRPGMWLGMLLFANAAMLWLGRRPLPPGPHTPAMFTGGNVGMVLGMALGGVPFASPFAHFLGMTAGMVGGMLAGTWAAERLLRRVRSTAWRSSGLRARTR